MSAEENPIAPMLQAFVQPWHDAIADPAAAQERLLKILLTIYAKTEYGQQHGAERIGSIEEYRRAFPVMTYSDYEPILRRVMGGETHALLEAEPLGWAMTRGTTGSSKYIPMTPRDLEGRHNAARAVIQYVLHSKRWEILLGANLNLSFPSIVGSMEVNGRIIEYGYATGIYVKHVAARTPIRTIPSQEAIDELGGDTGKSAWEARFRLTYETAKDQNMTILGGAAQVMIKFGKWMRRTYGVYPKDVWKFGVLSLGSTPGINTTHRPRLLALYGQDAGIAEIYGATEGMFGQQRDDQRYWVPNYDLYFFEVETRDGIKMMNEMKPGETGSLIASTPVLPRYKILDVIRAYDPPYFQCIGRDRKWTRAAYWLRRAVEFDVWRR
ncbi:MAG TPA: GH3 auxin-responsive promoter family protein [Aggregatilineaceae bacterium]|nr:GH3 auxin-responsive promoter family protein [Aggregatilineaceae bacterium]